MLIGKLLSSIVAKWKYWLFLKKEPDLDDDLIRSEEFINDMVKRVFPPASQDFALKFYNRFLAEASPLLTLYRGPGRAHDPSKSYIETLEDSYVGPFDMFAVWPPEEELSYWRIAINFDTEHFLVDKQTGEIISSTMVYGSDTLIRPRPLWKVFLLGEARLEESRQMVAETFQEFIETIEMLKQQSS